MYGNGTRKSHRNPDFSCRTIRTISSVFCGAAGTGDPNPFTSCECHIWWTYWLRGLHYTKVGPFIAFSRGIGDLRNGVWFADLSQGDSPDTKHDCSRFPAIAVQSHYVMVGSTFHQRSVKTQRATFVEVGEGEWPFNISIFGLVCMPPRGVSSFPQT